MDLIIFNPPRYSNGKHHKFNNALLWLASYLHQRNIEVRIVPLKDPPFEETVQAEIANHEPKFAAVSCKWWDTLFSSSYIASLVKKCAPEVVTIAGGHTASFFASELVENTDFDVVIRGDGEEPLYRLVSGQVPTNLVLKGDRELTPASRQYVQTDDDLKDISLIEHLEDIISDVSVLDGYIWTGKGCTETCVYCAANIRTNLQNFGRGKFVYRPIARVLQDIAILNNYPAASRITLDFDPIRGNLQENYHLELFAALPPKKHNCYFFSWSLPSKELIDALAKTFNFVELCIDVQTPSDSLRKLLSNRRLLKPYFSDEALEDVLDHCHMYDNFMIDLSAIMGLPFEQENDIRAIYEFSDYFYDKYPEVRYPYVSPMNVEPGSLLFYRPERYDMVLFRKSFADFMRYTQNSFENSINCYQPESYGEGVFHPLGVAPREDYERGDSFHVYEIWKQLQKNIDRRSQQQMMIRAAKYKKYRTLRAGILGGIDRPA